MARARSEPLGPDGDLPDPATLAAYRDISPECLAQILSVFIAESHHQRRLEARSLWSEIVLAHLGLACGFVVAAGSILAGWDIAQKGNGWAGAFLSNGMLVSVVSVFVLRRRGQQDTEQLAPATVSPSSLAAPAISTESER